MFAPWLANAGLTCLASVQLAYWVAWGGSLALSIALVLTTAAWLRGAEYDEQYTLFLTSGVARPDWPSSV